MSLNQRIIEDLKAAMKAKDAGLLSCLRLLKTAIKNLQVEKGQELNDDEIQQHDSEQSRNDQQNATQDVGAHSSPRSCP